LISVPDSGAQQMTFHAQRRRYIARADAPVWWPGGRWGPRRVRVNECWGKVTAEELYSALLADTTHEVTPGAAGTATYTFKGHSVTVRWEVRPNAVWKRGRVFLRCGRCDRLATRLYLPLETSGPACRRCYGLTYVSRTQLNYRDTLWGRGRFAQMFGTSQRDWAYEMTSNARARRWAASIERWAARRKARLASPKP
jgi:hypothetical protein